MKQSILKKMIKDAVKEAIQEELKDILLEAIKSPKPQINESYIPPVEIGNKGVDTPNNLDLKSKYENMMGAINDTKMSFTSQDAQPLGVSGVGSDPINGQLPNGSVSLDQIGQLLKT
mgnify:CR=1 FL=1|tara:strand:+ start:1910 stop:2260 length:351 start_codon:yes stop_codon:yes gene_type:complete